MDEEEPRDEELHELLSEMLDEDMEHIKGAMNKVIDPLSKWIHMDSDSKNLTANDLVELLDALAYAQFVVHGVMYGYGVGIDCDHEDE